MPLFVGNIGSRSVDKKRSLCRVPEYIFQEQFGKGLLSAPDGWREIDDWFASAKKLLTIEEELNRLVRPKDMAKSRYVIHTPSHRLGLDICYDGAEVGSKAVYNFLEKHQPRLSLHGHIHESPEVTGRWYAKLGMTIVHPSPVNLMSLRMLRLTCPP